MAIKLSKIINSWVPENSKVIDFGCGDGSLLKELFEKHNRPSTTHLVSLAQTNIEIEYKNMLD